MAIYKCKMCGGQLNVSNEDKIIECDYCGTTQTLPKTTDPNIQLLFNRATTLLQKAEYDKAEEIYEKIISIDDKESEAYWGLILCKYGIEYVEDPKTFKRIPTCHRSSYDSVIADEDYKKAIFYADISQKIIYEEEAKKIDEIQKGILEIASKEEPYDIFISYKESDEYGKRTNDSAIANDIYYQLTNAGYKVFFSAITLEDKLGKEYEPIIFSALQSSKVMLVIGTKVEYLNAVWVKNEWSRFLKLMKNDRTRLLIPCYKDINPYDLPEEFSHLQAQDMNKIGFINDLIRGIKKVLTKEEKQVVVNYNNNNNNQTIEKLIKRAFIFIEDGQFEEANEYCEKVLDIDVEYGKAYLGKLLAELKVKNIQELMYVDYAQIHNNLNLSKVYKYCDSNIVNNIKQNLENFIIYQKDLDNNKYPNLSEYLKKKHKKKVIFDSSIKLIPDGILKNCDKVESITIQSSVTSIGDGAFYGCGSLNNINIPDSVTSIGKEAFSGCASLTSIVIPKGVTRICSKAFKGCTSLISITLPFIGETKTENTKLQTIFEGLNELVNSKLKEVIILEGCTSIEDFAFRHFMCLESVKIPSSVTCIKNTAFIGCTNLENILVDSNNKNYKSIDGNLYTVDGKELIKYASGKKCNSFEILQTIAHINYAAFIDSKYLENIFVDENNINYKSIDGNLYTKNCETLLLYPRGKKNISFEISTSVKSIGPLAFFYCENLESITIPEGVICIGAYAFSRCKSLTNIFIPESVICIGAYAFYGCERLTSIVIPEGVICIEYEAFRGCESLTSIVIPEGVTSIEDYAFYGCKGLTSIVIPKGLTSIGYLAFSGCESLTSIVIPEGVTSIEDYAFYGCKGLTSIVIPKGLTSIRNSAFSGCDSLENITIQEDSINIHSVFARCNNFKRIEIQSDLDFETINFKDFKNLENITVSDNNLKYKTIDGNLYTKDGQTLIQYAQGKPNASFEIPSSVTSIVNCSFSNCVNLKNIILPKDTQIVKIEKSCFDNCNHILINYEDLEFTVDKIFGNKNEFNLKMAIEDYNQVFENIRLIENGTGFEKRYKIPETGCDWLKIFYDNYLDVYYDNNIEKNHILATNESNIQKLENCIEDVTSKIANSKTSTENKINNLLMVSNSIQFIYDTVYKRFTKMRRNSLIKTAVISLVATLVIMILTNNISSSVSRWFINSYTIVLSLLVFLVNLLNPTRKFKNGKFIDIINLKIYLANYIETNLGMLGDSPKIKKLMVKLWSESANDLKNKVGKIAKKINADFVKKLLDKCDKYNSEVE